jgi:hypothetical protein
MSMTSADVTVWGEIQGQTITFPMEVPDLDAATFMFTVPAAAAQALLPGDDFEVIDVGGGNAQLVIALVDYIDNPWGDYLEVNLGFLARPAGASEDVVGSFVYRMPVDQEFTCEAGNRVMGFPKTVEDLSRTEADGRTAFTMRVDGEVELSISFPTVDGSGERAPVESVSYSYLDGRAFATPLTLDLGTAVLDPADVSITLGSGVVAEELRTLGLPKAPDFASWGSGLSGTFLEGRPLHA